MSDTGDWGHVVPFQGSESPVVPSPYPSPSQPEREPYRVIPAPGHMSNEIWQTSYYDPGSDARVSEFVKLPSGPADLGSGRLTGDGFHRGGRHWHQV